MGEAASTERGERAATPPSQDVPSATCCVGPRQVEGGSPSQPQCDCIFGEEYAALQQFIEDRLGRLEEAQERRLKEHQEQLIAAMERCASAEPATAIPVRQPTAPVPEVVKSQATSRRISLSSAGSSASMDVTPGKRRRKLEKRNCIVSEGDESPSWWAFGGDDVDYVDRAKSERSSSQDCNFASFVRKIELEVDGGLAAYLKEAASNAELGVRKDALVRAANFLHWWNTLREPNHKNVLDTFVRSRLFDTVCICIILANGMFIAYETNYDIQYLDKPLPAIIVQGEIAFLSFYSIELALKMAAWGRYFFVGQDMRWNLFDLLLVLISLVDLMGTSGGMDLTFMRMLKFFKFAKILRMLKVLKFFSDLRLMIDCAIGSVTQLFWCLVMIVFIMYMFSLFFVQDITLYLEETEVSQDQKGDIMRHFGSVQKAMLSLFQATTSGMDWEQIYTVVSVTPLTAAVFLFYISFFLITVWNIVTSTFVEKALKYAQPDIDQLMLEKRRKDFCDAKELADLFKQIGCNGSNMISKDMFAKCVENPDFEAFLQMRGIDIKEAKTFFQMVTSNPDMDRNDEVDIGTMVGSCIRIKGLATSIDLHTLLYEVRQMHRIQSRFFEKVQSQQSRLETLMLASKANPFIKAFDRRGGSPRCCYTREGTQREAALE